jgi:hypothetical protein
MVVNPRAAMVYTEWMPLIGIHGGTPVMILRPPEEIARVESLPRLPYGSFQIARSIAKTPGVGLASGTRAIPTAPRHFGEVSQLAKLTGRDGCDCSIALAARKSGVSKPSVNLLYTGASSCRASSGRSCLILKRAKLRVLRNSHDSAPCSLATSIAAGKQRSATEMD